MEKKHKYTLCISEFQRYVTLLSDSFGDMTYKIGEDEKTKLEDENLDYLPSDDQSSSFLMLQLH